MPNASRRALLAAAGLGVATLPLPAAARSAAAVPTATRLDVISDIQGDLHDFAGALAGLHALGTADALIINGDLVPSGAQPEYEAFRTTLMSVPHPRIVLSTLGNHELYTADPFDAQVGRFLRYTGMPDVYHTRIVGGLALVFLGTTAPASNRTQPPFVTLGAAQLGWLDRTLSGYASRRYVLVFSHHVLPGTVSGTVGPDRGAFYQHDYVDQAALLAILGRYPNVVFFSGHTHWDLYRPDWAARKIVAGGHPHGFAAVNTGFIQTVYRPDGRGNAVPGSPLESQGLRVLLGADGTLRIEARDFRRGRAIRTLALL